MNQRDDPMRAYRLGKLQSEGKIWPPQAWRRRSA